MTIDLSTEPDITNQSPPIVDGHLTVYGPLILDADKHILTGPSGWVDLRGSEFETLKVLMVPRVVSFDDLAAAAFPREQKQPRRPDHAIAVRIARLRTVLETVGVSADAIRAFPRMGYGLGLGGTVARTYTGRRVRMLDALLASHPDRAGVAELEGLMVGAG